MNPPPSRKPPTEKVGAARKIAGGPRPFRKDESLPPPFPQHDVLLAVHKAYLANKVYIDEMNPTRSLDPEVCVVQKYIKEKLRELLLNKDLGVFIPSPKFWIGADKVADANHWVKASHIKPETLRSFAVGKNHDKSYAVYEVTDEGIRFENWHTHRRPRTKGEKQVAETKASRGVDTLPVLSIAVPSTIVTGMLRDGIAAEMEAQQSKAAIDYSMDTKNDSDAKPSASVTSPPLSAPSGASTANTVSSSAGALFLLDALMASSTASTDPTACGADHTITSNTMETESIAQSSLVAG